MDPLFEIELEPAERRSRKRAVSLYHQLKEAIRDGRLAAGARLPASRHSAAIFGVSRNTVADVYDRLSNEGLVVAHRGSGTFVAERITATRKKSAARYAYPLNPFWLQEDVSTAMGFWRDPSYSAPSPAAPIDFRPALIDPRLFPFDIYRRVSAGQLRGLEKRPASFKSPQGNQGNFYLREAITNHIALTRAVVFSALMMIVVGALGAVENLIERSALGESAGAALEFGVPLAIGVLFQRLHRWIEARVDQILFREEHKSRAALRDFVRDAGFVENADVLVGRMVAIFAKHAGGRGAALYELRGNGMECSAQDGNDHWPDVIDVDDPGLVRLRATLGPVDLHEAESALGREGLALPLALRGRIFGVLVCGPRAAGRYAQAEAQELGQAAHDVGASLFALRGRANEVLIEKLAQGQVQVDRAVVEARKLAGMM